MLETVTITRVSVTDKKKDGTKLQNKFGEFFRVGIQVEGRVDSTGNSVWINGFLKRRPEWEVGDKIQVEIREEEYKGVKSLQFRLPKKDSQLESRVLKLEEAVFGKAEEIKETSIEDEVASSF